MLKHNKLNDMIENEDIKGLKEIVKELKSCIDNENKQDLLNRSDKHLLMAYRNEISKVGRQMFESKSTCDVSDGVENTLPWQLGTIKAYCDLLLNEK